MTQIGYLMAKSIGLKSYFTPVDYLTTNNKQITVASHQIPETEINRHVYLTLDNHQNNIVFDLSAHHSDNDFKDVEQAYYKDFFPKHVVNSEDYDYITQIAYFFRATAANHILHYQQNKETAINNLYHAIDLSYTSIQSDPFVMHKNDMFIQNIYLIKYHAIREDLGNLLNQLFSTHKSKSPSLGTLEDLFNKRFSDSLGDYSISDAIVDVQKYDPYNFQLLYFHDKEHNDGLVNWEEYFSNIKDFHSYPVLKDLNLFSH